MTEVSFSRRVPLHPEYSDLRRWGLFAGIVFGPVRSRRLGTSLGINPFPPEEKICSFDCPYCECGRTTRTMAEMRGPALRYPSVEEVGRELEETLTHLCQKGISPDALTLAGNGEPTLHPDFPGLVDAILRVRKVLAPRARVVLLTNATLLGNPRIQAACLRLDEVMAKLDAGRAETMRRIDLPLVAWSPERLVEVARNFPRDQARLTIQTIFLEGTIPNTSEEEIRAWIEHLGRIRPDAVEIYTLDRAPATPGLRPVSQAWLTALAERVRAETGLVVHVS